MTPNLSREAEEELQMMVDKAYAECRQRSRLDRTDPETHPIKTREQCEELSRVQVKDKEYLPDKGVWFEKVDLASVAGAVGNQFKRHMFGSPPGGKQAPKGVTAPFGARPMMVGGFGR
ncbi:MAG: hypothetical protein M1815_004644 [Lichina confinis]|nr:MAG: hypothetical protein M1815_004644 [Lichina confinis]